MGEKLNTGAGEMAWQLGACAAFAEDLSLIPEPGNPRLQIVPNYFHLAGSSRGDNSAHLGAVS